MPHDLQSLIASLSAQLGADLHPITAAELDGLTALLPLVSVTVQQTFGPWTELDYAGSNYWIRSTGGPVRAGCHLLSDEWRISGGGMMIAIRKDLPIEVAKSITDLLLRARGYRLVDE